MPPIGVIKLENGTKLKPCPFCGGPACWWNHGRLKWFCGCMDCKIFSQYDGDRRVLAEAWNKRKGIKK